MIYTMVDEASTRVIRPVLQAMVNLPGFVNNSVNASELRIIGALNEKMPSAVAAAISEALTTAVEGVETRAELRHKNTTSKDVSFLPGVGGVLPPNVPKTHEEF